MNIEVNGKSTGITSNELYVCVRASDKIAVRFAFICFFKSFYWNFGWNIMVQWKKN